MVRTSVVQLCIASGYLLIARCFSQSGCRSHPTSPKKSRKLGHSNNRPQLRFSPACPRVIRTLGHIIFCPVHESSIMSSRWVVCRFHRSALRPRSHEATIVTFHLPSPTRQSHYESITNPDQPRCSDDSVKPVATVVTIA